MTEPNVTPTDQPVGIGPTKGFTLPHDCEVTIIPAGHSTTAPPASSTIGR